MLCGSAQVCWSSLALHLQVYSLMQSMLWLIMARALAGIGAGGIVSLVWTITSEIVEVQSRAKWSQALSVTWCCSAVAGPLLGGVFSGVYFKTPGTLIPLTYAMNSAVWSLQLEMGL